MMLELDERAFSKERIQGLVSDVTPLVERGDDAGALRLLQPLFTGKIAFNRLDYLGVRLGEALRERPYQLLLVCDAIIDLDAMASFVVASRALVSLIDSRLDDVIAKSREYIVKGDKWYVCDIVGERSLVNALVNHFDSALPRLDEFLRDTNRWVRRSVGVAIHFFSRKVRDEPERTRALLGLVEPYVGERQIDAVKGIGWGLKTIGRYHPDLLVEFLTCEFTKGKRISRSMVRKAVTYLDAERRTRVEQLARGLQG